MPQQRGLVIAQRGTVDIAPASAPENPVAASPSDLHTDQCSDVAVSGNTTKSLTVKETYVERQARLDAEAVDRWVIKVADMAPMSDEQIRSLAVILNRIDARLARERAGSEVISPTFT
jgi:hypothetical protein